MVISQRQGTSSFTPANGDYTLDRWIYQAYQAGKVTCQQNAGSVTPPVGFTNYLGYTSTSAYTVGSGEAFWTSQRIEGFNIADLGWGTANAKTVTFSFWVRSSLTGTFGGAIGNSAGTQSYPFGYTISSANTWEQKTITVAGSTTGSWPTDNSIGLLCAFSLGAGSTFSGTAGAWAGSQILSVTGATSVVGTNGATFYITGVQLEVGTQATSFEYRQYGTELALCQRYFEKVSTVDLVSLMVRPDGYRQVFYPMKQTMRGTPTSTFTWNTDTSGVNAGTPTLTASYFYVWSASPIATSNLNPYITALALSAEL
jgi:hypothetical protein